jgi:Domain of unknown function (DUF4169)
MADILNLHRFKKTKAKTEQTKTAESNRIKFGLTKAQKQLNQKQTELTLRALDGHKREDT